MSEPVNLTEAQRRAHEVLGANPQAWVRGGRSTSLQAKVVNTTPALALERCGYAEVRLQPSALIVTAWESSYRFRLTAAGREALAASQEAER